jgi:hypothetical protein
MSVPVTFRYGKKKGAFGELYQFMRAPFIANAVNSYRLGV